MPLPESVWMLCLETAALPVSLSPPIQGSTPKERIFLAPKSFVQTSLSQSYLNSKKSETGHTASVCALGMIVRLLGTQERA